MKEVLSINPEKDSMLRSLKYNRRNILIVQPLKMLLRLKLFLHKFRAVVMSKLDKWCRVKFREFLVKHFSSPFIISEFPQTKCTIVLHSKIC